MKKINLKKLKLNQKIKIIFLNGESRVATVVRENDTFGIMVKFKYNHKILTRSIGTDLFSKHGFDILSPDKRSCYKINLEII